ncbi:hypothetical protein OG230_05830 [Streptomyces sp. NBC_00234]|uniref:hypothetical protein n=1 Tax=Streptomyces sp. NBC_00234 TaxID=2903638 RepID=UPI002E2B99CB|nr:hypothetical protein [Streptomyces sp. NBC_00234]
MKKRISVFFVAFSSILASGVYFGAPASAAVMCSDRQLKEFATPGENVDVSISLCVEKVNGVFKARAYGTATDGGGLRKFDSFIVEIVLEKSDVMQKYQDCIFTTRINDNANSNLDCTSPGTSAAGRYTADGSIYYDLDGDGQGGYTWQLTGSPSLA